MMSTEEAKTAEFARLFDLFERLASRGSRAANDGLGSQAVDDIHTLSVPAGLAPVVKSLATLVGTRNPRNTTSKKSGGWARRNTIANRSSLESMGSDDDDDDESLESFPLGKEYPFTFKMMLHKLYQLDDWKMKVKEVLERSKIDYKPLAEQELLAKERSQSEEAEKKSILIERTDENPGAVHFRAGVIAGGGRREVGGRPRSHSVASFGKGKEAGLVPVSSNTRAFEHSDVRAVKKRCIGRRKSMNGPLNITNGKAASSWVYDVAVSAAETRQRQSTIAFMDLAVVQSATRSRYQSLRGVARPSAIRRRISSGVPSTTTVEWTMPFQPLVNRSANVTRRRATTVADITAPDMEQHKRMKRPFAS